MRPYNALDSFNVLKLVPTAFAGATANARGNVAGTGNPRTLFTVTGDVIVRIFGVCTTGLAGATGTVAVGVTGNTAAILPVTTGTDLIANEQWNDATPTELGAALLSGVGTFIVSNGLDIIETVATANITSGDIYYICLWRALSPEGMVTRGSLV